MQEVGKMYNYKNTRITDDLINMTNKPVALYDDRTGEIIRFDPKSVNLPVRPVEDLHRRKIVHYIVDEGKLRMLNALERSLDDIAIVNSKDLGRDGVEITKLVWAKNPKIPIRLMEGAHSAAFVHL